jgi:glycosyltransferase involved in cell wall biosynthesis
VHSSITPEPFGKVVVEGMLAGKPVVATAGGGVPEIVDDGETGLLVPMGDADAMAAAIAKLLADPARAQTIGRQARQAALESFPISKTVAGVEKVFDGMLKA